ncbi:hypothetical protein BGX29_008544 [Mortierella sp. GBA35]|nr:hypothetical protein BGX29_008544 [Mortierella sp. GBA35]
MPLTQAGFAKENLPPEVLFRIGKNLDGPSLFSAFQVNKAWKCVLSPHLWTTISGIQWQHPTFPFCVSPPEQSDAVTEENDAATPTLTNITNEPNGPALQQYNPLPQGNAAIPPNESVDHPSTTTSHPNTAAKQPKETLLRDHLEKTRTLTWMDVAAAREQYPTKVPETNEDLPISRLANIFELTSHVKRLAIKAQDPKNYARVLTTIIHMTTLEDLELQLPNSSTLIFLAPFYHVFSQLQELVLKGKWYAVVEQAEEEGVEQWEIRRLTICRDDLGLLRHCQKLEMLHLLPSVPLFAPDVLPPFTLLSHCTGLKDLQFPNESDAEDMAGLTNMLSLLTSLEKLSSFGLLWAEQAELLTTGKREEPIMAIQGEATEIPVEALSNQYALPALRDIEVVDFNLTARQRSRFVGRLLQQRSLLERVILPDASNVPIETLIQAEWACLNLTEIKIALDAPEHSVLANQIWRSFYNQIGKLTKLQTLHIICPMMEKSANDGIMAIKGAVSLMSLTVIDFWGDWSHQDIVELMKAAPVLKFLDLAPLSNGDYNHITQWLEALGKTGILTRRE